MTRPEAIALIKELKPPLVKGVAPSAVCELVEAAQVQCFSPGCTLLRQGSPANRLMLLMRGQARLALVTEAGRRLLLRWAPPGKALGLASLMPDPAEYMVTTEATEECCVLTWDRATMRGFTARYPTIWENMFVVMTTGISVLLELHATQTCHSAPQRVARALVSLADIVGRKTSGGIEFALRNEDLAHTANVTLFTVSRLLSQWQRSGLVRKTRGRIVLRSPESLLLKYA